MTDMPADRGASSAPSGISSSAQDGAAQAAEGAPWDVGHAPTEGVARPRGRPPADGLVFAEAPLRAVAFAIDSALITVLWQAPISLLIGVSQVLAFFGGASEQEPIAGLIPIAQAAVIVMVSAVLVVYFWRVFRASPGQMLLGLFVLGTDGRRLTVGRALLRWAVLFGPPTVVALPLVSPGSFGIDPMNPLVRDLYLVMAALPVAWPLLLGLTVIRDERGRGLHDRLAGSVVVRRDGSPG